MKFADGIQVENGVAIHLGDPGVLGIGEPVVVRVEVREVIGAPLPPAVDEEQALMRLEQLDLRSRILELGFERIDLRNPDVVAVRPRGGPQPAPVGQATAAGV